MNAKELHSELEAALANLEKTRVRLESLRDWTRAEVARQNTADVQRLLDKSMPAHLRQHPPTPEFLDSDLPPAHRAFANARALLRGAGLIPTVNHNG